MKNLDELKGIINAKVKELEDEKESHEKVLNASKYLYSSDLETINNILVCEGKIEVLEEILESLDE